MRSSVGYSIKIKTSASKALNGIPKRDRLRLIEAIERLRAEPLAGGALKGEFSGLRRLRIGIYRVVYEVIHEQVIVLVVRIGHRRDVDR
ncbi:MAG: mRNA interferase RelE/StbE [Acidobacteriota bacterium]|nr:mRNA interferase RelE/StbE [Acidobacteriota bacterium]